MARPKNSENSTKKDETIAEQVEREEYNLRMKNAIWTCQAFHFSTDYALKYINKGLLGFEKDKKGEQIVDQNNKPVPITISRATFFTYKKRFEDLPELYNDLRSFAMEGYSRIMYGFQEELASLHRISAENLLALQLPLERQQVVSSIVKDIIPTESAFADMLKKLVDSKKIAPQEEKQIEPKVHTK